MLLLSSGTAKMTPSRGEETSRGLKRRRDHRLEWDQDPCAALTPLLLPHLILGTSPWLCPRAWRDAGLAPVAMTIARAVLLCTERSVAREPAVLMHPGAAVAIEMGDYEHKGLADSLDLIKV